MFVIELLEEKKKTFGPWGLNFTAQLFFHEEFV